MIILLPPIFDDDPRFRQTVKPFRIKAFAPKRAIETFVTPVLPGFPWGNPTGRDALAFQEIEQGPSDELRAVVTAQVLGTPILSDQPSQHLDHALMREGARHLNGRTPARVLILHRQTAKRLAVCGHIVHEIPAPHGVFGLGRRLERQPGLDLLPWLPLWHLQVALLPHSVDTLEVHAPPATPQKAFG